MVLFPKILMSAFTGFVFYSTQYKGCLMTGSSVWYFVIIEVYYFEFHFLNEVYYSAGLIYLALFSYVF